MKTTIAIILSVCVAASAQPLPPPVAPLTNTVNRFGLTPAASGLDFVTPYVSATNGGSGVWSNCVDHYFQTYWSDFLGTTLGDHQTNWFEIRLPGGAPHWLAFRIAVLGSASEAVTVTISNPGFFTNYFLTNAVGPGWPSMYGDRNIDWSRSAHGYTWSSSSDLVLRFTYSTGAVTNFNSGINYGAVDFLCWEDGSGRTNAAIRIDNSHHGAGPDSGLYGEIHDSLALSWQYGFFTQNNELGLVYSTNGPAGPWLPSPWRQYTDLTGHRWVAYVPRPTLAQFGSTFFTLQFPDGRYDR